MSREYFLRLARRRLAMPIGTDLVLNERTDAESVRRDGQALGQAVVDSAHRWQTPLAIPLMDLRLEKRDLLGFFGVPEADRDKFHFLQTPDESAVYELAQVNDRAFPRESTAQHEAIRVVCREPGLMGAGMVIGPFSLATKLMDDPIPPIAMACAGTDGAEEPTVELFERCLKLAAITVARAIGAQLVAGAKAILICEPAASIAYLSPRRLHGDGDGFDRFVLQPHIVLKRQVEAAGADYLFHDCGELVPEMVERIGRSLHPTLLSLGSSRRLWEDADILPKDVVLFGNLPTRQFYSDAAMPDERVAELTRELCTRMASDRHPFILGSECDVLYVEGAAATIVRKTKLMLQVAREFSPET